MGTHSPSSVSPTPANIAGLIILDRYEANFPEVALRGDSSEGVVFKRRSSLYVKRRRASAETRDWLKRRFAWD